MKHSPKYWITVLILAVTFLCYAQNPAIQIINPAPDKPDVDFYHLRTDGSMEQNSITSITQDQQGRIWFSTKDGLVKYDAKEFSVYKFDAENPQSIPNNFLRKTIDCGGTIWVASKGMSRYHPDLNNVETIFIGES